MDEDVVYIYVYAMEYSSVQKKNEIMPFVTAWMNLEIIILSEVNQTEKDNIISDIIWQNDTNELICKTEIDSQT